MTNAERIQMLSTWDLAEFIYNVSNNSTEITTCNEECNKCEYSDGYCTFQIAEWLNKQIGADRMSYWDNITEIYNKQTAKGIKEYGQRLEDNKSLTREELITMAQEELVDALMYMEALKNEQT